MTTRWRGRCRTDPARHAADARLGPATRELLDRALSDVDLAVSAVSFCEVGWLARAGRLALPTSVVDWRNSLLSAGLGEIPLDGEIAIAAALLPEFHKDLADRLILATALVEGARLVTSDGRILAWPGTLDRADARR